MGKSVLSNRIAKSWTDGNDKLNAMFDLVLLVSLADYRGSIENFIQNDLLPSYFGDEK